VLDRFTKKLTIEYAVGDIWRMFGSVSVAKSGFNELIKEDRADLSESLLLVSTSLGGQSRMDCVCFDTEAEQTLAGVVASTSDCFVILLGVCSKQGLPRRRERL
jgi:hypothetical protein